MTGDNVLIEYITFRNFNFTGNGGVIYWTGNNGNLKNCKFNNNTAKDGGVIYYYGGSANDTISDCTFIDNKATSSGGAIFWIGPNGKIISSIFTNNNAKSNGGSICWGGAKGTILESTFTNNHANNVGGAIHCWVANITLIDSTFNDNTAGNDGGAIYLDGSSLMVNCNFVNSKSQQSNGIYATKDLHINGGSGIVYILANTALSGISIVVLNNETYYYPPNSNINLPNNKQRIP